MVRPNAHLVGHLAYQRQSRAHLRQSAPLLLPQWYYRPVHLYANISVSKVTRTVGRGALELPFDGERCI